METNYINEIRRTYPNLVINDITFNRDGFANNIVFINNDLVFRFPKNDSAREILIREIEIIDILQKHIINLKIPRFELKSDNFVVYKKIKGKAFLKKDLAKLSEYKQDLLADILATFIMEMNSVPLNEKIPASFSLKRYNDWEKLYNEVQKELFPYMMKHVKDYTKKHFESALNDKKFFDYSPALIHGDLAPYHVIYDSENVIINGIIDFGASGEGDPATDLSSIINYQGESFLFRMFKYNPAIQDYLYRSRFWANSLLFEWAIRGMKTKNMFWHLRHIDIAFN